AAASVLPATTSAISAASSSCEGSTPRAVSAPEGAPRRNRIDNPRAQQLVAGTLQTFASVYRDPSWSTSGPTAPLLEASTSHELPPKSQLPEIGRQGGANGPCDATPRRPALPSRSRIGRC